MFLLQTEHNFIRVIPFSVPGNIHSGVSGNESIVATGVYSARELLRVTRSKYHSLYSIP